MKTLAQFKTLQERHSSRIFTFSQYYLRNREDAEDVTQEVLMRMWKNLDKVDHEKLPAWVMRVTKNACLDVLRKRGSYRNVVAEGDFEPLVNATSDEKQNPHVLIAASELRDRLMEALEKLGEPYRSIILMREVQQLSYAEVSDALELPLNTMKVYLHRGRRMLRDQLRERVAHGEV
jgi:RNA polymerase sigma-70 factor (ECF subfamily)